MSCFLEFIDRYENMVQGEGSFPLNSTITEWKLYGNISEFSSIDDMLMYANVWYNTERVLTLSCSVVFATLLLCLALKLFFEKQKSAQRTMRSKRGSVSSQQLPLVSLAALRHPTRIRQSDKIFLLVLLSSLSLNLCWGYGAFGCIESDMESLLCYSACLTFAFHAASYYMSIIKQIVAATVKMGAQKTTKVDTLIGLLQMLPPYFTFAYCVVAYQFYNSFLIPFRVMYAINLINIAALAADMVVFGNRAIKGLQSSTGQGNSKQLEWVKKKVKILVAFICGATFSVGSFVIAFVASPLLQSPYAAYGIILYFSAVLVSFNLIEICMELVHIRTLAKKRRTRSKVTTTNRTSASNLTGESSVGPMLGDAKDSS